MIYLVEFAVRSDGAFLVQNSLGVTHKLGLAHMPVSLVYRDGKHMIKLPETHLATETFGICCSLHLHLLWCGEVCEG